jgi:DNA-binding response OmpR family regulator
MPQMAKESGADAFVEKPFEMENLLALVAHYVRNE